MCVTHVVTYLCGHIFELFDEESWERCTGQYKDKNQSPNPSGNPRDPHVKKVHLQAEVYCSGECSDHAYEQEKQDLREQAEDMDGETVRIFLATKGSRAGQDLLAENMRGRR